ncbi:TadE/TadG family type IV pilus assembly protein [Thermodesulfobacteriota bacterium]
MRSPKNRRGAAVVEFAFLLIIILLILAGVIEFGFLWLQSHYINNAAREGARVAAKTESPQTTPPGAGNDAVIKAVEDYLADLYPTTDLPDHSINVVKSTAGDTDGYKVTVKVKIIRIFGGDGSWFFTLFSPGDSGNYMTGSAFFADETP